METFGELLVFSIQLELVSITSLADDIGLIGLLHGCVVLKQYSLRHLSFLGWPHDYFARASVTVSAFIRSSAYMQLSHRFFS
jgi:hypothetical protein